MKVSNKSHQGERETERKEKWSGWREIECKLCRGQNELIGAFRMAASDVISIRGQVMEYMYIPTGIKRELLRSGVDCDWKG